MATAKLPGAIGIESDVLGIVPERQEAQVRLRIDNTGAAEPVPPGEWLRVRVKARLYGLDDVARRNFDLPLAEGRELAQIARVGDWTCLELPLPRVLYGAYGLAAKVYAADDRYRKPFEPSNCRLYRATVGELLRVERTVLEDVYLRGGYGNPAAEEELRRRVRAGAVVAADGQRLFRASEQAGRLQLEPVGIPSR